MQTSPRPTTTTLPLKSVPKTLIFKTFFHYPCGCQIDVIIIIIYIYMKREREREREGQAGWQADRHPDTQKDTQTHRDRDIPAKLKREK